MTAPRLQTFMGAILSGQPVNWSSTTHSQFPQEFLETSARHGVQALLYEQLKTAPARDNLPNDLRERLRHAVYHQAANELLSQSELQQVLNALAQADIRPLLLKGVPLAYTLYSSPALRPRSDTDLLIRPVDRADTIRILEAYGYRRPNATSGTLVFTQSAYVKTDRCGVGHCLDVHWQINNAPLFAHLLSYEELEAHALAIPALGKHARGLGPVHALLLACFHRIGHLLQEGERLIWLYDIHLLAQSLKESQWAQFTQWAREKRLRAICLDAFNATENALCTAFPPDVIAALQPDRHDIPTAPLTANRWQQQLMNFRSLPTWRERLILLTEHLLPPVDYMLAKYQTGQHWLLPWLYLRRAVGGVWKYWH
jgi:hypothetical protein